MRVQKNEGGKLMKKILLILLALTLMFSVLGMTGCSTVYDDYGDWDEDWYDEDWVWPCTGEEDCPCDDCRPGSSNQA